MLQIKILRIIAFFIFLNFSSSIVHAKIIYPNPNPHQKMDGNSYGAPDDMKAKRRYISDFIDLYVKTYKREFLELNGYDKDLFPSNIQGLAKSWLNNLSDEELKKTPSTEYGTLKAILDAEGFKVYGKLPPTKKQLAASDKLSALEVKLMSRIIQLEKKLTGVTNKNLSPGLKSRKNESMNTNQANRRFQKIENDIQSMEARLIKEKSPSALTTTGLSSQAKLAIFAAVVLSIINFIALIMNYY